MMMMVKGLCAALLAVVALGGTGSANARPSLPPPPDLLAHLPERSDPHAVPFAGGVVRLSEVPYEVITGFRPLRLDLYLPPVKPGATLPLVVWVHGGAFELGDQRTEMAWPDWPAELAAMAARGFAVASVSYRLSGEAKFPAQIDDVRAALAFLAAQKGRWGLDPEHVMVWGGSAGAHLALLAGLRNDPARDGYHVRGIVDWFGPADLSAGFMAGGDTPVTRLLGCSGQPCSPARLQEASPAAYVTPKAPPLLILHGTEDSLVPMGQSTRMVGRYRSVGRPVEMEAIDGVEHAWAGATPGQLAHILSRTAAFFADHAHD